jgi:hypothetical protein
VDDEIRTRKRRGDRLERRGCDLRLARRAGLSEPLPDEREQRQSDADADDGSRA